MHIDLKLGLSCNNACIHCIMEPIRKNLVQRQHLVDSSFENIESIIDTLKPRNVTSITLTGGEPTLRPDFFALLEKLHGLDLELTIQTNGRILGKEKAVERLRGLAGDKILFVIALHGADASVHDKITRVKGSFAETVQGIKNLRDLGFKVCGKMVLSHLNVNVIAETLDFMSDLIMDEAVVAFPHAEDFTPRTLKKVVPSYSRIKESLANITFSKPFHHQVFWETIPFCQFPDPVFYARSMDLCYLGENLQNHDTVIEMSMLGEKIDWQKSRRHIKAKAKNCSGCIMDKVCEGVWKEYFSLYDDEDFHPIRDISALQLLWERL